MLDRPPRESEARSWIHAILWSGLIFATIPFVRSGAGYVRENWGGEVFTYGVAATVVLVAAAALLGARSRLSVASHAWIVAVAGLVIYLSFGLAEGSPEEAVHYLQYGILSILLFRAFAHRTRDRCVYAAATIAGSFVGMVDETIQWVTPDRTFDLRDVWLNASAVALVQLCLAAGIRPHFVAGWWSWASLWRVSYLAAGAVAYLGLCLMNTPDRVAWYTEQFPILGFIDPNEHIMVEYGYLHGETADVHFRSRLTAEELRRSDRERAEEGARILDLYRVTEEYDEFLETYSPLSDPFLHEARVHLFRRDAYLRQAKEADDDEERGRAYATAYWENRILEDYFGGLLRASSFEWPAGQAAEVARNARTDEPYDSWVSRHLIVAFSRGQLFWAFLAATAALLATGYYAGRRAVRETASPGRTDARKQAGPAEKSMSR